jgi:hypothetical protein
MVQRLKPMGRLMHSEDEDERLLRENLIISAKETGR